jgi:DNA-binding response OmpR family regulator
MPHALADDDTNALSGLAGWSARVFTTAAAATLQEAAAHVGQRPDVVLLDSFADGDGMDLFQDVEATPPVVYHWPPA